MLPLESRRRHKHALGSPELGRSLPFSIQVQSSIQGGISFSEGTPAMKLRSVTGNLPQPQVCSEANLRMGCAVHPRRRTRRCPLP